MNVPNEEDLMMGELAGHIVKPVKIIETEKESFEDELTRLINKFSLENGSNTPDYILAQYMIACLRAFDTASLIREKWYGKSLSINIKDK